MKRNCRYCSQEFEAKTSEVNRGNAKYCSRVCGSSFRKGKEVKEKPLNTICSYCSIKFYMPPSKRKNSRHGYYFCSRKHKDLAQRIGGVKAIMPPHYGTAEGAHDYRKRALEELPNKCLDCGWMDIPEILIVHHIDENRSNNQISNLAVLCSRCHDIRHYRSESGRFSHLARIRAED